ncbi:MAG: HEAT repeat domain-containing protein [Planctomycetes bacterium]|nr:HEAT repeat domain-containing protein [Planctomycetota bacterium]
MRRFAGLLVLVTFWFATDLTAHGGWFPPRPRYGGPGDVVPSNPRGSNPGRPTTPATPSAPSTPSTPAAPSQPSSPNAPVTPNGGGTARGGGTGPTTARGIDLTPDLTRWDIWWHYNRDRYLQLRGSLQQVATATLGDEFFVGIRPASVEDKVALARSAVRDRIAPFLREVLEQPDGRQRDELSSALVALAKLGVEPAEALRAIRPHLQSGDQEIRETAALSLGILGHETSIPLLLALASDNTLGRSLVQKREVDLRTRAFACYGLGLVGHRLNLDDHAGLLDLIRKTLLERAADDAQATPDLEIASLLALSIMPHGHVARIRDVHPVLDAILENGKRRDVVRAHVPTVYARLAADHQVERLSLMLANPKEDALVRQSIVLALGTLGRRADPYRAEAITTTLFDNMKGTRSAQETYFATIALGQIGTSTGIEYLLRTVEKGPRLERTWAAIALGVHAFQAPEGSDRATVQATLSRAFQHERAGDLRGAIATALGLSRSNDDALAVRRAFDEERDPIVRGQLAISLGLMQAKSAAPSLLRGLDETLNEPDALQEVAIGLGLLRDRGAVEHLLELLSKARTTYVHAALARAIGWIGDGRTVTPLIEAARDMDRTGEARAFAIVALGLLGDKEDMPFQAKLAQDVNYFAGTSTLNGGINGVLDVL